MNKIRETERESGRVACLHSLVLLRVIYVVTSGFLKRLELMQFWNVLVSYALKNANETGVKHEMPFCCKSSLRVGYVDEEICG